MTLESGISRVLSTLAFITFVGVTITACASNAEERHAQTWSDDWSPDSLRAVMTQVADWRISADRCGVAQAKPLGEIERGHGVDSPWPSSHIHSGIHHKKCAMRFQWSSLSVSSPNLLPYSRTLLPIPAPQSLLRWAEGACRLPCSTQTRPSRSLHLSLSGRLFRPNS